MYKDPQKQRDAVKAAARRRRAKLKGITVTPESNTQDVIPLDDELFAGLPKPLRIYANSKLGGEWYRRQIYWLKTTPIEQLKADQRISFIPCWRYAMETKCLR